MVKRLIDAKEYDSGYQQGYKEAKEEQARNTKKMIQEIKSVSVNTYIDKDVGLYEFRKQNAKEFKKDILNIIDKHMESEDNNA